MQKQKHRDKKPNGAEARHVVGFSINGQSPGAAHAGFAFSVIPANKKDTILEKMLKTLKNAKPPAEDPFNLTVNGEYHQEIQPLKTALIMSAWQPMGLAAFISTLCKPCQSAEDVENRDATLRKNLQFSQMYDIARQNVVPIFHVDAKNTYQGEGLPTPVALLERIPEPVRVNGAGKTLEIPAVGVYGLTEPLFFAVALLRDTLAKDKFSVYPGLFAGVDGVAQTIHLFDHDTPVLFSFALDGKPFEKGEFRIFSDSMALAQLQTIKALTEIEAHSRAILLKTAMLFPEDREAIMRKIADVDSYSKAMFLYSVDGAFSARMGVALGRNVKLAGRIVNANVLLGKAIETSEGECLEAKIFSEALKQNPFLRLHNW